ncbi:MAG: hypothetical protein JW745_05755, partial [Sedimentisphaerales bacterium]|nr:hypothetical protein [Sedimentisphaerales bacterium]
LVFWVNDCPGRQAVLYYSDGSVLSGELTLASGSQLKCNIPESGDIYTSDMVTGEPVRYGKVRRFGLDSISKIEFFVQKEELIRKWRFGSQTAYDRATAEADYSPAEKLYSGEYYPVRYLAAVVAFNGGEVIAGHIYSAVAYLDDGSRVVKISLLSKSRGLEGQSLDDLVYVQCIKFVDAGKSVQPAVEFKPEGMVFQPGDKCYALSFDSLVSLPASVDVADGIITVESSLGEGVMLAIGRENRFIVGWPTCHDDELLALAGEYVAMLRDFYNERQLVGIWHDKQRGQLLTLVNLRRRFADTNFGEIGGEWDKQRGSIVEPWRLSVWRWLYDKENRKLTLIGRGSFCREIKEPSEPVPAVEIQENLWFIAEK